MESVFGKSETATCFPLSSPALQDPTKSVDHVSALTPHRDGRAPGPETVGASGTQPPTGWLTGSKVAQLN